MGLFSGGGILGDVGGALGINTDKQEGALEASAAISAEQREAARADLLDFSGQAQDTLRTAGRVGSREIRQGRQAGRNALTSGQFLAGTSLGRGEHQSIAALLGGADQARTDIVGGTDAALERLAPQLSGLDFLDQVNQGATIGGFGENIAQILTGGSLNPLIAERLKSATGAASAAGLNRSSAFLDTAAEIPTELAFTLENLITGRATDRLSSGFQGAQLASGLEEGRGLNLAQIAQQTGLSESEIRRLTAGQLATLFSGTSANLANLELGSATQLGNIATGTGTNIANILSGTGTGVANLQIDKAAQALPLGIANLQQQRGANIIKLGATALAGGAGGANPGGAFSGSAAGSDILDFLKG